MRFSSFLTGPSLSGLALAAGLSILGAGAAMAQATTVPIGAPTDVSNIGSWTVRCAPVSSPNPCEMYEESVDRTTRQRILGVTIAYVPSADKHLILIAVPLGVSIGKGVTIQTDSFTSSMLPYRRCDNAGCYVEMVIDNSAIDSLSHSGDNAAIKIFADTGKAYSLTLKLDGFSAAHDKMAGLAKQKAKALPPQQIDASAPPAQAPTP